MVRLTPELIEDSFQYINPIKEYELCLRGKTKPSKTQILISKKSN